MTVLERRVAQAARLVCAAGIACWWVLHVYSITHSRLVLLTVFASFLVCVVLVRIRRSPFFLLAFALALYAIGMLLAPTLVSKINWLLFSSLYAGLGCAIFSLGKDG